MPVNVIKKSIEYCIVNKAFFIFVLLFLFLCQTFADIVDSKIFAPMIMLIIMIGYGLTVTRDVIKGGSRLPKIMPKDVLIFGTKGVIIIGFYWMVQNVLLSFIAVNLNFPPFDVEGLIMNYRETIHLFMTHNPASCIIFIICTFIIVYTTTFFMEIALGRLADGGQLANAFDFLRIKHVIDMIGWRNYTLDYTRIIISLVILSFLLDYDLPMIIDSCVDAVLYFLIFAIEFIGIGNIYREYVNTKT